MWELQTLRDMDMTLNEISRLEKKMCKIDELVEEKARKQELKVKPDEAETRLNLIQIRIDSTKKVTNQERLNIIEQFKTQYKAEGQTIYLRSRSDGGTNGRFNNLC